jgi:pimeloyl-ACP methyl ester carboxylesterase
MAIDHAIWFERAGIRLFAVERGAGVPVIFLHGGLADHRAAQHVAGATAAPPYRLITPDLRGAGRSRHPGPLTWADLADDVAALACHLGVARAVVGGSSFGAGCAVAVALRHPALVAALVLVTPAYGGAELGLAPAQAAAMAAMDAAGRRCPREGITALHPLFAALPDPLRARARAMVDGFDPASVAATTAFMASGAQPFAAATELAAIAAPVLLVPGTDPTHPPEVAAVFRRHLRDCTVHAIAPADFAADHATPIAAFVASGRVRGLL